MFFLFFNDTATTEIYTYCHTLSLHDALPILVHFAVGERRVCAGGTAPIHRVEFCDGISRQRQRFQNEQVFALVELDRNRSEEHTSELQSLMRISYAVFCLKKKNNNINITKYR